MRLLDVGCGWGGMVVARRRSTTACARSASRCRSARPSSPTKRVAEAGLTDRVEIRLQDYRDVHDGPFDAISSIGMFEHVGRAQLREYFDRLHELLPPERPAAEPRDQPTRLPAARHAARSHERRPPRRRRGRFAYHVEDPQRLHGPLRVPRRRAARGRRRRVDAAARRGFEVRHVESLREHYALTLRHWVRQPRGELGRRGRRGRRRRARVWRLYMAASAPRLRAQRPQIHQVLAVRTDGGRSGMPLAPDLLISRSAHEDVLAGQAVVAALPDADAVDAHAVLTVRRVEGADEPVIGPNGSAAATSGGCAFAVRAPANTPSMYTWAAIGSLVSGSSTQPLTRSAPALGLEALST